MVSETNSESVQVAPERPAPVSPLHLIRQKELEISGKVLAARREADAAVAEARRKAAEIVSEASERSRVDTSGQDELIRAESRERIAEIEAAERIEVAEIQAQVERRFDDAVSMVMSVVLGK